MKAIKGFIQLLRLIETERINAMIETGKPIY